MSEKYPSVPYSMSNTLHIRNNEYFGMYRGTVLDNEDPEFRGRCKVYVYGVYDEKFKEENGRKLPWAEPSQPLFCGGYEKNGTFQCPDLNATVWVFFDSGDITRPIMFGQTTDKKSLEVDKTYQHGKSLFSTDSCTLYWDGMYIEMYKPTHTVTVSAMNISAFASIDLSGHAEQDVYLDAIRDMYFEAGNNMNIKVGNNMSIEVGNNVTEKVGNSVIEDVGTTLTETIGSSTIRKSPTNTIDGQLTVTGATTINASTTINATTTINADNIVSGKSFLGHIHGNGNMGSSTTPPV